MVKSNIGLDFTNSAQGVNSKKLDRFCSFAKMLLFIKRPSFLKFTPCAELVKLSLVRCLTLNKVSRKDICKSRCRRKIFTYLGLESSNSSVTLVGSRLPRPCSTLGVTTTRIFRSTISSTEISR